MSGTDAMRAAFEKREREELGTMEGHLHVRPDGLYQTGTTQRRWWTWRPAWRAALASVRPEPTGTIEVLRRDEVRDPRPAEWSAERECWEIVKTLAANECESVEVCHPNPDFDGPAYVVEWSDITDALLDKRGEGDTYLDALRALHVAVRGEPFKIPEPGAGEGA